MIALSLTLLIIGLTGALCSFIFAFKLELISPKTKKTFIIIGIICTILFIIGVLLIPKNSFSSNGKKSATCPVCHKTFSYEANEYGGYDYDNVKKIQYSNMCERCYNNYKAAQYAKDYID